MYIEEPCHVQVCDEAEECVLDESIKEGRALQLVEESLAVSQVESDEVIEPIRRSTSAGVFFVIIFLCELILVY